jgi:hypothetical protein
LDEDVYFYVLSVMESLQHTFSRLDAKANDGIAIGMVPKSTVMNSLKEIWKHKSPKQIGELTSALKADQAGSETITYSLLFQNQTESAFLEAVKLQEMEQHAQYLRDFEVHKDFSSTSKPQV